MPPCFPRHGVPTARFPFEAIFVWTFLEGSGYKKIPIIIDKDRSGTPRGKGDRKVRKKLLVSSLFLSVLMGGTAAYGLTADQVLKLKNAGVSDATIQLMIRQEMEAEKNPYERFGRREIRDGDGNTVIVYSTGSASSSAGDREAEKAEKAWELLRNLIIDAR